MDRKKRTAATIPAMAYVIVSNPGYTTGKRPAARPTRIRKKTTRTLQLIPTRTPAICPRRRLSLMLLHPCDSTRVCHKGFHRDGPPSSARATPTLSARLVEDLCTGKRRLVTSDRPGRVFHARRDSAAEEFVRRDGTKRISGQLALSQRPVAPHPRANKEDVPSWRRELVPAASGALLLSACTGPEALLDTAGPPRGRSPPGGRSSRWGPPYTPSS